MGDRSQQHSSSVQRSRQRARRTRALARGLTKVELALSVSLATLLVAGVALMVWPQQRASENDQATERAQLILEAAREHRQEARGKSGCPTYSVLVHERRLDPKLDGHDPWGHRYRITCERDLSVVSPGRDGQLGTDDDVRVSS